MLRFSLRNRNRFKFKLSFRGKVSDSDITRLKILPYPKVSAKPKQQTDITKYADQSDELPKSKFQF